MLKKTAYVVLALLVALALTSCAKGGKDVMYKIGTNAEYPPFENVDEAGEIVGFDVDLMDGDCRSGGI